jgi:RimJ/RimL family protein N-acetyltransferase
MFCSDVPSSTAVEDAREDAMDITITAFPEEKLAAIAKWRSDGEVHRYLRHGYTTLGEVSTWYRDYFSTEANCLLGILVDNQLIGYCTIEHIDHENHKCEVGIVIGEKDYWYKGIGSAVIRELLKRAFTALHLHRVEAVIHADNVASIHCFARAGFQCDGTLRDAKYRDGRYVDLLVYSLLDSEWIE